MLGVGGNTWWNCFVELIVCGSGFWGCDRECGEGERVYAGESVDCEGF